MSLDKGFDLDEWRVEPETLTLSCGSRAVTIEPQTMGVLLVLAANAGHVVTADELIEAVWDGRPMADNPVYKAIAKLRQALGDEPRKPRYIQTISKRGYRLVAPVSVSAPLEPASTPHAGAAGQAVSAEAREPRRVGWWSAGLGVVLLAIGALLIPTGTSVHMPSVQKLVDMPGSSYAPALSSDGRYLAFLNDRGGGAILHVLEFATGAVDAPLAGFDGARTPAWSPTGDRLLFGFEGDIWQMEVAGHERTGEPVLLIENAAYPAWSPDAQQIVFERGTELWLSRADGLGQVRLGGVPAREQFFAPRAPVFTPDGNHLVFFETRQGPMGHLFVLDLNTQALRQLTQTETMAGKPVLSGDGEWVYFHAQHGDSQSLWRVAFEGGAGEVVLSSSSDDANPVVLPDGGMIYESAWTQWSLVVTDLETGATQALVESRRPLIAPEVSPDRSAIAYFGPLADGSVQSFVQELGGGLPRQVTRTGQVNVMPKWAEDGASLYVYHSAGDFSWQRVQLRDGQSQLLAPGWNFNREHDATPRPHSHEVIYAILDSDTVVETRIRDLATGAEKTLPFKASWFEWSADGTQLLATEFAETRLPVGRIVLCNMSAPSPACTQVAARGQHPVWGPEDRMVYFVDPIDSETLVVYRFDPEGRETQAVATLAPAVTRFSPFVDVLSDTRLVWIRHRPGQVELWRLDWR